MTEHSGFNPEMQESSEHKILPVGIVLHVDDMGYLVSESAVDKITPPWDKAVADIKDAYADNLGTKLQSLYIRGSVGRGNAIEGVSDIDGLAVVYGDPKAIDWTWPKDIVAQAKEKYPFIAGVDITNQSYEAILGGDKKIAAFMIKTMSACVYGEDLAPALPQVKPGRDAVIACWDIERKVSPDYLAQNTNITIAQKMRWSAKQILRAGFELVMEDEQAYTRDLYPCYKMFSDHYPAMEPVMHRALEMALWPSNDEAAFLQLLSDVGEWLVDKVHHSYPSESAGT